MAMVIILLVTTVLFIFPNASNGQQRKINSSPESNLVNGGIPCSSPEGRGECLYQTLCRIRGGQSLAPCIAGIIVGTCCQLRHPEFYNSIPVTTTVKTPSSHPSFWLSSSSFDLHSSDSGHKDHVTLLETDQTILTTDSSDTIALISTTELLNEPTDMPSRYTEKEYYLSSYPDEETDHYYTTKDKLSSGKPQGNSLKTSQDKNYGSAHVNKIDYASTHFFVTSEDRFPSGTFHLSSVEYQPQWQPLPNITFPSADDFPLGAIQQIIADFANESALHSTKKPIESLPFGSMAERPNDWPTVIHDQNIKFTLPMSSTTASVSPSVTKVSQFSTEHVTSSSTLSILGVHVANSTSSSLMENGLDPYLEFVHTTSEPFFEPTTESTQNPTTKRHSPKRTTSSSPSIKPTVKPLRTTIKPRRTTTRTGAPVKKQPSTLPTTKRPLSFKQDCGVRPFAPAGRIVGGKKAVFGQWPWQALVKEASWFGLVVKTKCGGVLVSKKYVVTAAHCQPGWFTSLLVMLGEYDLTTQNGQLKPVQRNVRKVVTHRDFNAATFENDLALLELDRTIEFEPHIVPICLPAKGEDFTGQTGVVSGWGRLSTGGSLPTILHFVDVPIIENSVCQKMFLKANQVKAIRDTFVCAGYKDGGKDSCEGDSGGPLMVPGEDGRWRLVGTVSHGIKCAYPNLPGVYTRISAFIDWINKNMK